MIDLNKFNTLLDKPKHNSHIKALRCFDVLYPGFIYQYSEFEKLANESSNSKLNLTGVDYRDETRYDKTELKTKQKSFNLNKKKYFSTLRVLNY